MWRRKIGRARTVIILGLLATCVLDISSIASPQTADAQAAFQQAVQLLQAGKTSDALDLINASIAAGARDPALYNLQGLAASELGRDHEAEESFRTVIRLAPQSAMGYNNLGVLLSKLERYKDSTAAFREAQAREPQNFTALLGLGTSLSALHDYAAAAGYLEKAWNVRPGDFQAGYEWALALHETKQNVAAKKVLNQLPAPEEPEQAAKYYSLAGVIAEDLKEYTAASESYGRAYAIKPDSYEIYLALARTALSTGSEPFSANLPAPPADLSEKQNLALGLLFASSGTYAQAIPRLETAMHQDPANQAILVNLAAAYKNVGKSAAAMDLLRQALKVKPSADLYSALAGLEEDSGQYVEAVQSYQHAVELDPANEQNYFNLGMEYLSHFTFGPAAEVFRVGTQKSPKSSRQFLGLAFSHYAVREYSQSADAFTSALELDPDSPAVFQAWKTVLSFLAPRDWEALLPRLGKLATSHPQSADLAFCYGAGLFRSELAKGSTGTLDQSEALLEKSVRLRPNFPEAHLELANLYAARKQNQKAVAEYLEAIRQDPKSDIAHYRLGQVYRAMNKMELASEELTRYQELYSLRQEELKRSRTAIKQFVLSQPAKPSTTPTE